MNPLTALILGFTFSFAWTPCVGPALASVLLLAASASSSFTGFLLIGVYTLGFVLPFLAVGLFTKALLDFFRKYRSAVKYTVKLGGILMILIGVMMFTGWMNGISSYLSGNTPSGQSSEETGKDSGTEEESEIEDSSNEDTASGTSDEADADTGTEESPQAEESAAETVPAPDFTLLDQYGNSHTLSDYKGKTVFLNFWDIAAFLSENNYTYPVVMDTDGIMSYYYGISAYPTTFMIDKDGNVYGYVPGQITKDIMQSIIEQTASGVSP